MNHFLKTFNKGKVKNALGISPQALESLCEYAWPGNIRELENFVERMTVLKGHGILEVIDLPPKYRSLLAKKPLGSQPYLTEIPDEGVDFNALVDAFENRLIEQALSKTQWNRNQAAQLLRLNRTTLVEKIKKKNLKPPEGTRFSEEISPSNTKAQTSHPRQPEL